MDIPLTLKDAGLILMGALVVILLFYCISFMKNLVVTIKHTNKILEDAQVISKIAADRTKEVDKVVNNAISSVSSISENIKGNQSILSAMASIINTVSAFKKVVKK